MICLSRRAAFLCCTLIHFMFLSDLPAGSADAQERWSTERAGQWYSQQPWLVGCNFLPSNCSNQIEMWQDFDAATIDRELGWAESIGFNTVRVFLHDKCWEQDQKKFFTRIDNFLQIANRHNIRPLIVLFDGVWDPDPQLGPQGPTRPGVHNSKWVQGPGRVVLAEPAKQDKLKPYVTAVIKRYAKDSRVLGWDLFNEPDNPNSNSYGPLELPSKDAMAARLVRQSFAWGRTVAPSQPLTVGLWRGPAWTNQTELNEVHRAALELSDVISFHDYGDPNAMQGRIDQLKTYGRPLLCTEFMARGNKSTFEAILPILKREKIAAYSWGLVDGRSQTKYPWPTWQMPELGEPKPWHHDVFHTDGRPYRKAEVDLIKQLSSP